uniref:tRNA:m(4)X modification enzyme TRM13 n=1 Tax=Petromyzon marinus TaxID=7757 RepID=S4R6T0_PETMA
VAAAGGGDAGIQSPAPGCCAFFVARKRRYCKMSVAAGRALCGEHAACSGTGAPVANERRRIVCPLDSKHTVYEDVLEKHLKKCNAREKSKPAYYVRDINCGENDDLPSKEQIVALSSLSAEEMSALISKVQVKSDGLDRAEAVLELRVLSHPALQQELTDPSNGKSALKHLQQQASIVGHLSTYGLLAHKSVTHECGAGRGKLSHWLWRALPGATRGVSFLLVERCSTRFKVDGKHQEGDVDFRRLLIDIQHLHLGKVPQLQDKGTSVVAIGKHLCGAATDLALRCLMETLPRHGTRAAAPGLAACGEEAPGQAPCETGTGPTLGIAITLCCHHRCSWPAYVGKEYFCSQGLGPKEFDLIQRMSSWATCGWRRPTDQVPDNGNEDATREERASRQGGVEWHAEEEMEAIDHAAPCQAEDQISYGRSRAEREQLGRLCKRVLDEGRVRYLREWGLTARLQRYVEAGTTVENVLLTA